MMVLRFSEKTHDAATCLECVSAADSYTKYQEILNQLVHHEDPSHLHGSAERL